MAIVLILRQAESPGKVFEKDTELGELLQGAHSRPEMLGQNFVLTFLHAQEDVLQVRDIQFPSKASCPSSCPTEWSQQA